ncbi:MAG: ABC transporter ATP-binding protein [Pseudomonadota bacterium]
MAPILQCEGLWKSYGMGAERIDVVKDISMSINQGELVMIVGPSGCGKSTLLGILSGLVPPDVGEVHFEKRSLWSIRTRDRDALRRRSFGFVFQGFNLFASLSALHQVMFPLIHSGVRRSIAAQYASAALVEVGLKDKLNLLPRQLSGGEKQRVAIARALAKQPQFIFADEPTSALDSINGARVVELLKARCSSEGVTALAVTHDSRLHQFADRVVTLEDGVLNQKAATSKSKVADLA